MFEGPILHDQVAVVTGGGTGLGLAMAARFAELGAKLVIASRKTEHLEAGAREIAARAPGAEVLAVPLDVRKMDQVEAMVKRTYERFGRLDILVNNAAGNFLCPTENLSVNGWRAVVGIVLDGTFHGSLACGREWIARGTGGKILNIIATYAWTGSPFVVPSACSKAGVLALTQSLAVEWAKYGIRTNAIAPGPFPTKGAWDALIPGKEYEDMVLQSVPLGRFGTPPELANLAAYLVSDYASYVNGECVVIDGGQWLGRQTWGKALQTTGAAPAGGSASTNAGS